MEDGRDAFNRLSGIPTGNRPLGRPRHKWEDNIIMYLKVMPIQESELSRFRIGIIREPL
jgi:hypothetical protein